MSLPLDPRILDLLLRIHYNATYLNISTSNNDGKTL